MKNDGGMTLFELVPSSAMNLKSIAGLMRIRLNLKDGGSVAYKSLLYKVTKIHRLSPEMEGVKPYIDGLEVKILGMTVYLERN